MKSVLHVIAEAAVAAMLRNGSFLSIIVLVSHYPRWGSCMDGAGDVKIPDVIKHRTINLA